MRGATTSKAIAPNTDAGLGGRLRQHAAIAKWFDSTSRTKPRFGGAFYNAISFSVNTVLTLRLLMLTDYRAAINGKTRRVDATFLP